MLPEIDKIANRNHLQLVKAAIPYLPGNRQKLFSFYIKMIELQNVGRFFSAPSGHLQACSVNQDGMPLMEMLNDMKNYCDESEKAWLDQISNVVTAMELYSAMSENFSSEEDYE